MTQQQQRNVSHAVQKTGEKTHKKRCTDRGEASGTTLNPTKTFLRGTTMPDFVENNMMDRILVFLCACTYMGK